MSIPDTTIVGAGPPVVLVHGVGLDRTMWDGVIERLARTHMCVSFDMPGHGATAMPSGPVTPRTFSGALETVVASLMPARPKLVGFSMGAMVAQRFVLDHPGAVSGLILMNPVFERDAEQRAAILQRLAFAEREGPATMTEKALARWFSRSFRESNPAVIDRVRQRLSSNASADYLAAYRVFATADAELAPLAGAIDCQTLVVTAEHDANSTPAMTRALAAAIPGAQAMVLDGLAHGAPIEAPERVAKVIQSL